SAEVVSIMRETARFLGLNHEQLERANKSITNGVTGLKKVNHLYKYIDNNLKGHGFLVAHSLICSQLSYLLLEKMNLLTDVNLNKFQLASLLQDISLSNSKFAMVLDLDDKYYKMLTNAQQQMVWSHTEDSGQMAALIKG